MQTLIAFVGLPVAVALTAIGLGLLAERAARARMPNGLLAPVGFCVATCLLLGVYALHLDVDVAVGALIAGTVAGFVLAGRALPARLNPGWPGLAALATYVLYAAPMLLSGGWTWSGYNFLNDTAVQFLLVDHLKTAGLDADGLSATTGANEIRNYLGSGYPLGAHAYVATLSGLLRTPVEVIYAPFTAAMASLGSMATAVLAGRTLFGARIGAIAGFVVFASNLTYNYALQGSIKEIAVLACVATAAAVGRELAGSERPLPMAIVFGVACAAVLSVYNAAGLPYVLALWLTLALVVVLRQRRAALHRRWIVAGAAVAGVTGLAAAAALTTIVQFYRVASAVTGASGPSGDLLGNLERPLPLLQSGGIWLDGAFQGPIGPNVDAALWTDRALWAVAALALLGAIEIVRRRCPEALFVIVPAALTTALVAPRVVAYADAKLLAILSPFVLLMAAAGLLLVGRTLRPLGPVLAAALGVAVVGGVLLSDAYAYHDTKLAPRERMIALADIGERLAGAGPVLLNEFEEFAKYFAGDADLQVATEAVTTRQIQLRRPSPIFGRYFDLDDQQLFYLQGFPNIVLRRSPAASRPPADYARVYENRYYEIWKRTAGAPKVLHHLPLQRKTSSTAPAACADVGRLAAQAGRRPQKLRLVAAQPPRSVRFDVRGASARSPSFRPQQGVPGTIATIDPGQARGTVDVPAAGSYEIWLRGDVPRRVELFVDGTAAGTVQGLNSPGQWFEAKRLALAAGEHDVRVLVRGGSAAPGDGGMLTIGPVAFVRDEPARVRMLPVQRWRTLCGKQLDWIELVRP